MQTQKAILILGGGFGGIKTANLLARELDPTQAKIILIDHNDYHVYHPNLYELATSEEEFVSIESLKKSIALPLKDILHRPVEFIRGHIESIDHKNKKVLVDAKQISFDYLVVALGSTTDFFNIPGMAENTLTLKSVTEALRIRAACEAIIEKHKLDVNKKLIRFVIGGGGFTGVELAGEMVNFIEILNWKYNYPPKKVELVILEAMNQLLPGMPAELSEKIYWRLKKAGVVIRLDNAVIKVEPDKIGLKNGDVLDYDLLVWAGGIRSVSLPFEPEIQQDNRGRIHVDGNLRVPGADNIFIIGDCACVIDQNQRPLPATATQAIFQAEYIAAAIRALISEEHLPHFQPTQNGFIIAVRGKWAAMHLPSGLNMYGFLPWLIKRFADLHYFWQLMPLHKAVKLVWFDTRLYVRND